MTLHNFLTSRLRVTREEYELAYLYVLGFSAWMTTLVYSLFTLFGNSEALLLSSTIGPVLAVVFLSLIYKAKLSKWYASAIVIEKE